MSSNEIKPVFREDKLYEVRRQIGDFMASAVEAGWIKNCITCTAFNEPMELCNKFKAKPPARVIAYGCKEYFNEEEIPF